MQIRILIVLLLVSLCFSFGAETGYAQNKAEKKIYAVIDFRAKGIPKQVAERIRNYTELSLIRNEHLKLIQKKQMLLILREQGYKRSECATTFCYVSMGQNLSANYVVTGDVAKTGEENKYEVITKVISVQTEEILFAHRKIFDSSDSMEDIAKDMGKIIYDSVEKYELEKSLSDFYLFNFSASFCYLSPLGIMADGVNPGFGVSLKGGIQNFLIKDLGIGLEMNFFSFTGKINSSDRLMYFPVLFDINYNFKLFNRFYISPEMGFGLSYIMTSHGSGAGFSMPNNSEQTAVKNLFKGGVGFTYLFTEFFQVQAGVEYIHVLEQDPFSFLSVTAGIRISF
ncbi:MAG: hypothetical protein GY754_14285 [bacterium]|nr:hypothetical protein [bacterium]